MFDAEPTIAQQQKGHPANAGCQSTHSRAATRGGNQTPHRTAVCSEMAFSRGRARCASAHHSKSHRDRAGLIAGFDEEQDGLAALISDRIQALGQVLG